jgi:hypothetical protein
MDMLEGHSIFFLEVVDALGRVYPGGTPVETPEGSTWEERRGRKWLTGQYLFFSKFLKYGKGQQ